MGAAAAWAAAGCRSISLPPAKGTIDTHVHFYDPERSGGVPWPPPSDTFLYRRVLPPELKALAAPLGVAGAIIVEASPLEEDNQWTLDLAAGDPFILGVVGHLKPSRPGFGDALDRFGRSRLFRGIRTGLWNIGVSAEDRAVVKDLAALAERNLTLDIGQGVAHMESAARLADALPNLRIIINHFGGPRIAGDQPEPRWTAAVRALGRRPNVAMKLSGLVEGTGRRSGDAPVDLAAYRPWFDVVWAAFGPDRLLFGSNWPVSARCAPYGTVLSLATACLAAHGPAAVEAGLRNNAVRIYRLAATVARAS